MVMRAIRTEGGESGKRESGAAERGGKGLPEKVALEKDLRAEPWEHLRGGNIFLAEETAGAKALGWESQVFSENTSGSICAEQSGE